MIEFVKKHKICSILILLILSFLVYIKFFFVLKLPLGFGPPINYTKEEAQLYFRTYWEPFDITTLNTKRIHYHNHSGKFYHCFGMWLEKEAIDEKVKDFKEKYRFFRYETDAEFDLYKKDKPHLRVRIYRNNISLAEQDIYLMSTDAISAVIELNGKKTEFRILYGEITSRESACYHFEDDTDYEIEITNLVPFPKYEGIQSFFRIETTAQRYQPNVQEEKAP